MTTQGRDFLISCPTVGSKLISNTIPRTHFPGIRDLPHPHRRTPRQSSGPVPHSPGSLRRARVPILLFERSQGRIPPPTGGTRCGSLRLPRPPSQCVQVDRRETPRSLSLLQSLQASCAPYLRWRYPSDLWASSSYISSTHPSRMFLYASPHI